MCLLKVLKVCMATRKSRRSKFFLFWFRLCGVDTYSKKQHNKKFFSDDPQNIRTENLNFSHLSKFSPKPIFFHREILRIKVFEFHICTENLDYWSFPGCSGNFRASPNGKTFRKNYRSMIRFTCRMRDEG